MLPQGDRYTPPVHWEEIRREGKGEEMRERGERRS